MHVTSIQWGREALPLLVIDDFHPDPDALVVQSEQALFIPQQHDLYPGKRAPIVGDYSTYVQQFFTTYGLRLTGYASTLSVFSLFSIASTTPSELLPIQCIPHFDQTDPTQWALVHYLFKHDAGGTGFFRHRRSGFESITADRVMRYHRMLDDDAHRLGVPSQQYIQTSNALFELVEQVPAAYNRAILYPSNVLHTGLINPAFLNQPQLQRLTANSLLALKP